MQKRIRKGTDPTAGRQVGECSFFVWPCQHEVARYPKARSRERRLLVHGMGHNTTSRQGMSCAHPLLRVSIVTRLWSKMTTSKLRSSIHAPFPSGHDCHAAVRCRRRFYHCAKVFRASRRAVETSRRDVSTACVIRQTPPIACGRTAAACKAENPSLPGNDFCPELWQHPSTSTSTCTTTSTSTNYVHGLPLAWTWTWP